jgi:hypothetical protein
MRALAATKEALNIVQGNYSPKIMSDPTFYQDAAIWVEKQRKGEQGTTSGP